MKKVAMVHATFRGTSLKTMIYDFPQAARSKALSRPSKLHANFGAHHDEWLNPVPIEYSRSSAGLGASGTSPGA
jgi:hypothetical protein